MRQFSQFSDRFLPIHGGVKPPGLLLGNDTRPCKGIVGLGLFYIFCPVRNEIRKAELSWSGGGYHRGKETMTGRYTQRLPREKMDRSQELLREGRGRKERDHQSERGGDPPGSRPSIVRREQRTTSQEVAAPIMKAILSQDMGVRGGKDVGDRTEHNVAWLLEEAFNHRRDLAIEIYLLRQGRLLGGNCSHRHLRPTSALHLSGPALDHRTIQTLDESIG